LSTIENIGLGTIEAALLFSFIFVFMLVILNRKALPIRYPLIAFMVFQLAGSVSTISDRTSCELIVYNGFGLSTIGIRTGRILNLYTDSDTLQPEVAKHCFTRGLRVKIVKTDSEAHLIKVDKKIILICNELSNIMVQKTNPDLIILKGKYPKVDKEVAFSGAVEGLILTSEVASGYRLKPHFKGIYPDTIHYVRNSGAFRRRL
jgi:hypothetical protein